ncbi:sensor histidine kinase [Streptomyces violaceorubidus]|uniref:sensor histidine kinase n=1 Tax=Streptomyces violaceorubidus TaxID=284042 RepID=UPI0007C8613B|nr:sensor histidine kinase [Streptomyces violaceorubidus]
MSASVACPVFAEVSDLAPPTPETLTCSFTLPPGPASPRIARVTARAVLHGHGLDDMADAVVQVVGELAACACRFTPRDEVYVSLRYREGTLRVVFYDGHRRHEHPRLIAACDARRRSALRVLGCVVRACEGEWGIGEAREPGGGTRMWAVVPRRGARVYAGSGADRRPGPDRETLAVS